MNANTVSDRKSTQLQSEVPITSLKKSVVDTKA